MVDSALHACWMRRADSGKQPHRENKIINTTYMIGIVIVSYKNQEGTIAFINEQLPKIVVPWKAIVVDNSPDESVGKTIAESCDGIMLRHHDEAIEEQSRVYVISTMKNLGFARGNNLGADILARNFSIDYFLFSNDDIVISDSRVIEKMIL